MTFVIIPTSFKIGIGDISYVGGNSTAMTQTDILVHSNGQKELFNIVNGAWNKNSVTKKVSPTSNNKKLADLYTKENNGGKLYEIFPVGSYKLLYSKKEI